MYIMKEFSMESGSFNGQAQLDSSVYEPNSPVDSWWFVASQGRPDPSPAAVESAIRLSSEEFDQLVNPLGL